MPKYQVRLYDLYVKVVDVEASDPEEAVLLACKLEENIRPEFVDHDGEVVYELDEYGSPDGPPVLET